MKSSNLGAGKLAVASLFGLIIGFVAGLIGVGGGEFRLPVLVGLLGLSVPAAAGVNLVIGLVTVIAALLTRTLASVPSSIIFILAAMSLGSIAGAYFGAHLTKKIDEKYLKRFLIVFLVIMGLKLVTEPFLHFEFYLSPAFPLDIVLSTVFGALIGVVSGALGVAGGEMRIPTLMYAFSLPIKMAGTASLLVSIPTILAGAFKHNRMGHIEKDGWMVALAMGAPSVVGAFVGGKLHAYVGDETLKMVLGIILLLATVRMIYPSSE